MSYRAELKETKDNVGCMHIKRRIYSGLGILMVILGTAGILLPLVPTTPFLLLATVLFARSSHRLNHWLLTHRYLGPYIHAFRAKRGLTVTQKLRIGSSMTIVMGISFYYAPAIAVKYLLIGIWLFWTMMLMRMKTAMPRTAVDP